MQIRIVKHISFQVLSFIICHEQIFLIFNKNKGLILKNQTRNLDQAIIRLSKQIHQLKPINMVVKQNYMFMYIWMKTTVHCLKPHDYYCAHCENNVLHGFFLSKYMQQSTFHCVVFLQLLQKVWKKKSVNLLTKKEPDTSRQSKNSQNCQKTRRQDCE